MKKILWVLLALIALSLASCNKGNVRIARNFGEEISIRQNLVFTFSEEAVSQDSMIGYWIDQAYITFTPEVKGKFRWEDKYTLVFSPDLGFAPITSYKAEISKDALKYSVKKLSPSSEDISFTFKTPDQRINETSWFWSRNAEKGNAIELRGEIKFEYRVDPSKVNPFIVVEIDGKPQSFEVRSTSHTEALEITLPAGNANWDDKNLKITIKKDLPIADANVKMQQEQVYETKVPSKDNFQILGLEVLNDDQNPAILVSTNQELGEQNIASFVSIEPKVALTFEKYGSGFYIRGPFEQRVSYAVKIANNLQGIFGGKLKSDFEQTIVFGPQDPTISFTHKKGLYLSSKGSRQLGMRVVNVPKVEVKIYKIYENNIREFIRSYSSYFNQYDYDAYDYDEYYYSSCASLDDLGSVIYESTVETKSLPKKGAVSLLTLNFPEDKQYKGIYLVEVKSNDDNYIKATKVVSISDLGLMTRRLQDEVQVYVHSILTTEPVAGTKVSLISSNNQEIKTITTDNEGFASFSALDELPNNFTPAMITATLGDDFNYLEINRNEVETSRFDVGGAYSNITGYDAFLYGDRDLYRPGETIHLNTVVRNEKWETLKNAPVKVRLLQPNGKLYQEQKGTLNAEGAYACSIKLPATTMTGTYIAQVFGGNDVLLNSKSIAVEEFMPDRIKVSATLTKEEYRINETAEVKCVALNLFGPPAANRNYELELSLNRKSFSPKGFEEYAFDLDGELQRNFSNELSEGTTGEDGSFMKAYTFKDTYANSGLIEGRVFATVFDETGRPVHQAKRFNLYTQERFLGIKYFDSWVNTRQNLNMQFVSVNTQGKAIAGKATVQIVKWDWHTVIERGYNDQFRYVSQRKMRIVEEKSISLVTNPLNYSFYPSLSGEYEVRLYLPGAKSFVSRQFYAYSWGSTESSAFEVNQEGQVDITFDKPSYRPGETAKVLFKTPFAGKLIVAIERDKVYQRFVLKTDGRSASLEIKAEGNFMPNVYVSATLIRPSAEQGMPLTVAHGYAPFKVEDPGNKLPVSIEIPASTRSSRKQMIKVKTKAESGIQMTIAVVDEGILQIRNTANPDPYGYFYRKRALEVTSYDVYSRLLPEYLSTKSSVAGDANSELEKRANPMANPRIKLVSFWSGILTTNGNGEAQYEVDLPQFSGDLRVVAVAYKDKRFGMAAKNMKVADPLVVSTSLPRFISPGDTVEVSVTVTNTTEKATQCQPKLETSGPIEVVSGNGQRLDIGAGKEGRALFKVIAKAQLGQALIRTLVPAFNETFKEELNIMVRAVSPLVKLSGAGQVLANQKGSFTFNTGDLASESIKGRLIISKSPLINFTENLDYLIGYPHGCVEQTVSRAFPQLYLKDLIRSMNLSRKTAEDPDIYVKEAIMKLSGMQQYNGGFSYWPGGYEVSYWGSVYAAHFLTEAKKAGFEVEQSILNKAYAYLQSKIKDKELEDYYYSGTESGSYMVKQVARRETFYSLFLLAQVGMQDISMMNYYKSNQALLTMDSRYLLAATYKILGDQGSFRTLLPSTYEGEYSKRALGGSFYSHTRDLAISLNALMDSDPDNAQVGILTKHLSSQLKKLDWYSTQEVAFSFLALGKVSKRANATSVQATITANGKQIGQYKEGTLSIPLNQSGASIEIASTGQGNLYYFWEAEGISKTGAIKEEDQYLRVRREFYTRTGQPITGSTFKQNDLIIVRISLSTTDGSKADNVVITDALPAGFEIENPRLVAQAEMKWTSNASEPQYIDMRDDRIHLFTQATGTTKYYYYSVRAICPGNYKQGPIAADAMYNGEYHSYFGSRRVRIVSR